MAEPTNTDEVTQNVSPNDPLDPSQQLGDSVFEDSGSALDAHLAALEKEDEGEGSTPEEGSSTPEEGSSTPEDGSTPEEGKSAEGTPEGEGAAPDPPDVETSSTPGVTSTDEGDDFDKKIDAVQLPPHARPKSGEAFATVKTLAKEEIRKAREELAAAKAKLTEIEPKVGQLPEDVSKELEELRAYRASTDIEKAPEAVKAREAVQTIEQQVLDVLKQNGLNEDGLKHIEEIGGVANVDWKPILEKLPEQTQDYLKFKIAEHKSKIADQQTVVSNLKEKAGEFLKAREEEAQQAQAQADSTRQESAESILRTLPFAQVQEVPADAKPEDKKAIEQSNAVAKELRDRVAVGLGDTSPEMHATLAVSAALAFRYNAQNKAWAKAHEALKKELDSTKAELDKIRAARKGRRTPTPPPSGKDPAHEKGGKYQLGVSTDDALDAHLAAVTAQQD